MNAKLKRFVHKIKNESLRKKVIDLVQNPSIIIGQKTYGGISPEISPASKRRHHSYKEGLLQHIISSSTIALTLSDIVEQIYHTKVDRDLVLVAIITHDIMKPLTYDMKEDGGYNTSQLGEQIDHLTLIVSELIKRGFPLEVVHAVAAHHGRNSPINPRTIEALICFLADFTDATLNGEVISAAKFLIKRCVGEQVWLLNDEEAFTIVQAKQNQGCKGVREVFEQMKNKKHIER